ncbi:hypothetical protein MKEN_01323500 [Mycena kentingensis (nom. inval.)]|nr:hypothetical protein MKEN_01323500 [Mycena kentingensis (nom. inval.)]
MPGTLEPLFWGHRWCNAWYLIPFVILLYDHLLTLGAEIEHVWAKRKRFSFFLFVPLRYISLVSNAGMVFLTFGEVPVESCRAWNLGKIVLIIVQCVLVGNVLALRVYAIYNCSKPVFSILAVFGIVTVSLGIWSISGQNWVLATEVPGCQYAISPHIAYRMVIAWESQLVCDLLFFGFTLWRSFRYKIKVQHSLFRIIVRDGALYFGVLALVNAANIFMYYFGDVGTDEGYMIISHPVPNQQWIADSLIGVTMISRLMLNLHKKADLGIMTEKQASDDMPDNVELQRLTPLHFSPSESGHSTFVY